MRPVKLLLSGQRPTPSLDFLNEAIPGGIAFSGATNGRRTNSAGTSVAATTPRFNYSPVSRACKGLLIEAQRANRILHSVTPATASGWTTDGGATLTAAPGVLGPTGDAMGFLAWANGSNYGRQDVAFTAGEVVTRSLYVFAGDAANRSAEFGTVDGAGSFLAGRINVDTGETTLLTGDSIQSEDAGGGLWRVQATGTVGTTGTGYASFAITGANEPGKGHYFACDSIEVGDSATSVITTTVSAVTRTADVATFAWTLADGTYAVEFDLIAVTGTRPILSLDDGTADNQIRLYASGTSLKLTVTTGGVTQADLTLGTVAANTTYKAAFSIRANEFLALMNGGTLQSDTAGTVPVVTTGRIGSDQAGNYQNGHNKRTRAWRPFKSNLYPLVA